MAVDRTAELLQLMKALAAKFPQSKFVSWGKPGVPFTNTAGRADQQSRDQTAVRGDGASVIDPEPQPPPHGVS